MCPSGIHRWHRARAASSKPERDSEAKPTRWECGSVPTCGGEGGPPTVELRENMGHLIDPSRTVAAPGPIDQRCGPGTADGGRGEDRGLVRRPHLPARCGEEHSVGCLKASGTPVTLRGCAVTRGTLVQSVPVNRTVRARWVRSYSDARRRARDTVSAALLPPRDDTAYGSAVVQEVLNAIPGASGAHSGLLLVMRAAVAGTPCPRTVSLKLLPAIGHD